MSIVKINTEGFNQAEALLSDLIFKTKFDKNNQSHIKALKLLKAREHNSDFEMDLAVRICGDNSNYPYRSSYYLTKFFQDLGFDFEHRGETRRFWVESVVKQLKITDLLIVIERGLFRKKDYKKLLKGSESQEVDSEEFLQRAIEDFRKFIDESISSDETISLVDILDLDVNLELLFDNEVDTKDEELNKLIENAKSRFLSPNDKQVALEKLWDAFERIKTYFDSDKRKSAEKLVDLISRNFDKELIDKEFKSLTKIGNAYRIRHHETNKIEIVESKHLNYLFFRMLSLLDLCIISIRSENGEEQIEFR
jgi:hypothetical protein